jgi:hypothetical protein
VFGMTRTTRAPGGSFASIEPIVTPAAIETMSVFATCREGQCGA